MSILKLSKVFLGLSAVLVVVSIVLLITPGPRLSIEFSGGTLLEIQAEGKTKQDVETAVHAYEKAHPDTLGNVVVSAINGQKGLSFLLRTKPMSNETHVDVLKSLGTSLAVPVTELQYTTIGPSLSANLKKNTLIAIAVASIAMVTYLAIAFRKLPRKLNPLKFGVLAVIGFIHDVIITSGFFVVVSRFTTFEFDPLFVTALLTILAYSANDTIVIFDRIRDNMTHESRHETLAQVVDRGLRQCVTRTFNTMAAALIMLVTLFFFGSESIKWFILALIFGTVIGVYSSYFIAAPLLVYWKWGRRNA